MFAHFVQRQQRWLLHLQVSRNNWVRLGGLRPFFKSCAQKYAINTQETGRRPKIFEKRFTKFMLIKFIAAAGEKKVLLTHTYTAYLS